MLKIGDFSKLSFISIRMLRYYEEKGLLLPKYVDSESGYRYYDWSELILASKINSFKQMGIPVKTIKKIISSNNTEEIKTFLASYIEIKKKEKESINMQIKLLENTFNQYEEKNRMDYKIKIETIPAHTCISYKDTIPTSEDEGILWEKVYKELYKCNITPAMPKFIYALYHDKEYTGIDTNVEVRIAVKEKGTDTDEIKFIEEKEKEVVSCLFKGYYSQVSSIYIEMAKYLEDNNKKIIGPAFQIYHVGPGDTDNVEEYVTQCGFEMADK